MIGVEAGGERILIANVDGRFYAMRATCNHMGGSLDKGVLDGSLVTCPLHKSKWDVTSGRCVWFSRQLPPEPVFPVIVQGDQIMVSK
jgi:nitrite reductase/ring-hydroxylating ferredoxin subunit